VSYSFTITGHSPNPHNDDVVKIAVKAVRDLKALEGSVSITGYTYDSSGVNKALDDALVSEFEQLDAPQPETQASEPAPADSTESPTTAPTDGA
jgi:hypothetical protein